MFAAMIDDPRYGVRFVEHHLTGAESAPALRQLIMNGIKLVRAMDPLGWESRPDVASLRAWLDLLAKQERARGARQASVSPLEAVAAAFSRGARAMGDEELLYCRLAYAREAGRRGEVLRECVEAELLRRPWLIEQPEDASEYDPALY